MAGFGRSVTPNETPIDLSGLNDSVSIRNRKQLNEAEIKNIRPVLVKYLSSKPSKRVASFDLGWFLHLHDEMFCEVWVWAGKTRKEDLNLGIAWQQVETQLLEMEKDILFWQTEPKLPVSISEQAVRIHHRAVQIHPFLNGNGRWARLLTNIYLMQNDHPIVAWPEASIGAVSQIRDTYILAIQAADGGDLALLTELHDQHAEPTD